MTKLTGKTEMRPIPTARRILVVILAMITAVVMMTAVPADSAFGADKVKRIKYTMSPSMNSIKVKWKSKGKVSYYVICRTEFKVKNIYEIDPVPLSNYKKIKKVSGKRSSWRDKTVKKGHYYDYVIKGYRKSKGKAKMVTCSYKPLSTNYQCPGLQRPDLINGGYGENYSNSTGKLYLYVQRTDGVRPSGAEVYRKEASGTKYRKIKVKKMEKGRIDIGAFYRDSGVTPGKAYVYRARTFYKKNGKKYYSPYSNTLELAAVNFSGKYTAKAMTSPGTVEEFSVRMASHKMNGPLTLKGGAGEEGPYYSTGTRDRNYGVQYVELTAYSKDNKTWRAIPSDGLTIKAGQTVYLKFRFLSESGYFNGDAGEYSGISFSYENATYTGSTGFGSTDLYIDLKEGTGKAFPDYDN